MPFGWSMLTLFAFLATTVMSAGDTVLSTPGASASCPPSYGNCYIFPPDSEFYRPIDTDPIDYMSSCIVSNMGSSNLHLDFGTDVTDRYGLPPCYTGGVASSPLVSVEILDYASESDWFDANGALQSGDGSNPDSPFNGSYLPIPGSCPIESWNGTVLVGHPASGDRHMSILDASNCMLYETFNSVRTNGGGYKVSNIAIFNLSKSFPQRPAGWTSADAAGLPMYPFTLKYNELAAGNINHALRFTSPSAQAAYILPLATHFGPNQNVNDPPYGARFRLRGDFNVSSYSTDGKTFLNALKKYGLIYADQGSLGFIQGVSDPLLSPLIDEINGAGISWSNFVMVQPPGPASNLVRAWNPGTVTCQSVTANPSDYNPWFTPSCPALTGSSPVAVTPSATAPPINPTEAPTSGSAVAPWLWLAATHVLACALFNFF